MRYICDIRASLHKAGQWDEYTKSGTVPPKSGRLTPMQGLIQDFRFGRETQHLSNVDFNEILDIFKHINLVKLCS